MWACGPSARSFCASWLACTTPLTRSEFSSSVTTNRVCPEEMQRRIAVSTSSDRSTVTTAGAGVMIWRACCSCRWKTPVSMPASPGSSLPPVADCWISTRSSSADSASSSWPVVRTPSSLRTPLDAALRIEMNGEKIRVNTASGAAVTRAIVSAFWMA